MTLNSPRAGMLASVYFALSACGEADLTAYGREEFPACYLDGGAWAGEERAARYIEGSFEDFSRHFDLFLGDLERLASRTQSEPRANGPAIYAPLHDAAQANIVRLGHLLPRMNRPLDLKPMAGQFEEGAIWWPRGDHHTEYLRVAVAAELAGHQHLADHMAAFLSRFEAVEALLLDLKFAETDTAADAMPSAQDVARAVRRLREAWEAVEPGMRRVIFDRPGMPGGESLSERLQTRVTAICKSYSECGDDEGCDGSITSDGLTGEPMEAG